MATLMVINGPPGIGKTTTATALAAERAPAFRLDVDEVRTLMVGWEQTPTESGTIARRMVTDMAATSLTAGHDVIVSQLYGRLPDLVRVEKTATATGAAFIEIVLMAGLDDARERFVARGGRKFADLCGDGNELAGFDELYDRVVAVLAGRPRAIRIDSVRDDIAATLAAVRTAAKWDPPATARS